MMLVFALGLCMLIAVVLFRNIVAMGSMQKSFRLTRATLLKRGARGPGFVIGIWIANLAISLMMATLVVDVVCYIIAILWLLGRFYGHS